MLTVQSTYKDLQSEVEAQRIIIKKFQSRYKNRDHELKDLNSEHLAEKQDLVNELNDQREQLAWYKKVFSFVFKSEEIARIKAKSQFDDDEWIVPPFVFKSKELVFPKLNGIQMVNDSLESRRVEIGELDRRSNYDSAAESYRGEIDSNTRYSFGVQGNHQRATSIN